MSFVPFKPELPDTPIDEGCEVLIVCGGRLAGNIGRSGIAEKFLQPGDSVTLSDGTVLPYRGTVPAWFVSVTGKKLNALCMKNGREVEIRGADWAIYRADALLNIDDYLTTGDYCLDDALTAEKLRARRK